jgi:signal peptidase
LDNSKAFLDISAELLRQGKGIRFRPGGGSMHPSIRDREAVIVEPVEASRIERGDIILYRHAYGLTAHRVLRINPEGDERLFILRGDASVNSDAPVRAEQVLGRVLAVERDGRELSLKGRRAGLRFAFARFSAQIKCFAKAALPLRLFLRN